MEKLEEKQKKLSELMTDVNVAEKMINDEIERAARENRELDPKMLEAIDKVGKTKDLINAMSATLESINKLFIREVETVKK